MVHRGVSKMPWDLGLVCMFSVLCMKTIPASLNDSSYTMMCFILLFFFKYRLCIIVVSRDILSV